MQETGFLVQNNSIYYKKNFSILIVKNAIFLSLAIFFDFISSKILIFPLANFLKFNISFFIIFLAFESLGIIWGLVLAFILFLIGPSYGSTGYDLIGIFGHFISFIAKITFYFIYWIFKKTIRKDTKKGIYFSLFLSIFFTTIILTLLNVIFFVPIYMILFKQIRFYKNEFILITLLNNYSRVKFLFLNMNNYFVGASIIFMLFNLINLTINGLFTLKLLIINKTADFMKRV